MEPVPQFPDYGETITWGCQQIGDPTVTTSTLPDECSATRNTPPPGVGDSVTTEGLYVVPPKDLCYDPNYLNEPRIVNNDFAIPQTLTDKGPWIWTCNGSNDTVDSVQCNAKCKPKITINPEDRIFAVGEDGTQVEINIKYDSVTCDISYSCTIDGTIIQFDEGGNSTETFTYTGSDPVIECTTNSINPSITITPPPSETKLTAYCTEKSCTAQGTCQAMPKTGVTSLKDCINTCNSNADCTSGRMIETKP
jgi:hypothetical protein